MGIIRILKPCLFAYECVRIIILAFTLVLLLPETGAIPWLAFASAGALFPLMALFLWLDISRYKAFLPLYIAGKCIGIVSLLGWSVVSGHFTIIDGFAGVYIIAELVFLVGDLFALAAVLLIFNFMQKLLNKPILTEIDTPDTEVS
jgi:hypothetical protein